jgi:hypothetical protein
MATVDSINQTLDKIVKETPAGGGLMLTINLKVYDNGFIEIDGRPLKDDNNDERISGGSVGAWTAANEIMAMYLRLFARRVARRVHEKA